MFTGLVTDVGRISRVEDGNGLRRLRVESAYPTSKLQLGASVMHSGVCLTLVDYGEQGSGSWWVVEAIPETLSRTTLGRWEIGAKTNLELSLKLGEELGGHLVYGHIDAIAKVASIRQEGESRRIRFAVPDDLAKYFAEKGSVAVDGVSLTVSAVGGKPGAQWFEVALIPHTLAVTTLGELKPSVQANLEVDMLARYVSRQMEFRS